MLGYAYCDEPGPTVLNEVLFRGTSNGTAGADHKGESYNVGGAAKFSGDRLAGVDNSLLMIEFQARGTRMLRCTQFDSTAIKMEFDANLPGGNGDEIDLDLIVSIFGAKGGGA